MLTFSWGVSGQSRSNLSRMARKPTGTLLSTPSVPPAENSAVSQRRRQKRRRQRTEIEVAFRGHGPLLQRDLERSSDRLQCHPSARNERFKQHVSGAAGGGFR